MNKQKSIFFVVLFTFALLLPCRSVWATNPVKFDTSSITYTSLSQADNDDWFWHTGSHDTDDYYKIVKAKSSNEKVATVGFDSFAMTIHPKGVGKCDATATDENGNTATIHVTVAPSYMKDYLKHMTELENVWYGTKKIIVNSMLGATGKLKIGSKTYKFSLPKTGKETWSTWSEKKVKIDKVFKLNTKVKCTISYVSNGTKVTTTLTDKLTAATSALEARGKKKSLTLKIFNLHKGDTVRVKYKGKTYTRKINKDKDGKYSNVKFTLKKKLTKNATFTYWVTNKDKKQLIKEKLTLTNWKYEYVDDDIDDDYDDGYDDSGDE